MASRGYIYTRLHHDMIMHAVRIYITRAMVCVLHHCQRSSCDRCGRRIWRQMGKCGSTNNTARIWSATRSAQQGEEARPHGHAAHSNDTCCSPVMWSTVITKSELARVSYPIPRRLGRDTTQRLDSGRRMGCTTDVRMNTRRCTTTQ